MVKNSTTVSSGHIAEQSGIGKKHIATSIGNASSCGGRIAR